MRLGVSYAHSGALDDGNHHGFARLRVSKQNLEFRVQANKSTSMTDLDALYVVENKFSVTSSNDRRILRQKLCRLYLFRAQTIW